MEAEQQDHEAWLAEQVQQQGEDESEYEQDERMDLLEGQLRRENLKHSLLDYLNTNKDVDMV